jgi:hypothetical protein
MPLAASAAINFLYTVDAPARRCQSHDTGLASEQRYSSKHAGMRTNLTWCCSQGLLPYLVRCWRVGEVTEGRRVGAAWWAALHYKRLWADLHSTQQASHTQLGVSTAGNKGAGISDLPTCADVLRLLRCRLAQHADACMCCYCWCCSPKGSLLQRTCCCSRQLPLPKASQRLG